MCRLLCVKSENEFKIKEYLENFALIAKNSKEYQGHGWGLAYLDSNENWQHYKNIKPVWEDDFSQFPKTTFLLAHARSAFEDRDIFVENNMPFYDDKYVFIFNGELRGVRIKEEGRIGAEKIFNFIKRFDKGDMQEALGKAVSLIKKRSAGIRALNIIIASKKNIFMNAFYSSDPGYFAMHKKEDGGKLILCSQEFLGDTGWHEIPNNTIRAWKYDHN